MGKTFGDGERNKNIFDVAGDLIGSAIGIFGTAKNKADDIYSDTIHNEETHRRGDAHGENHGDVMRRNGPSQTDHNVDGSPNGKEVVDGITARQEARQDIRDRSTARRRDGYDDSADRASQRRVGEAGAMADLGRENRVLDARTDLAVDDIRSGRSEPEPRGRAASANEVKDFFDAVLEGDTKEVGEMLDDNPSLVRAEDNGRFGGGEALHLASGVGNIDMMDLLEERGADVNAKAGPFEATPLMAAAFQGQEGATQHLVEDLGADVTLTNKYNQTAEMLADAGGHEGLGDYLDEKAEELDSRDRQSSIEREQNVELASYTPSPVEVEEERQVAAGPPSDYSAPQEAPDPEVAEKEAVMQEQAAALAASGLGDVTADSATPAQDAADAPEKAEPEEATSKADPNFVDALIERTGGLMGAAALEDIGSKLTEEEYKNADVDTKRELMGKYAAVVEGYVDNSDKLTAMADDPNIDKSAVIAAAIVNGATGLERKGKDAIEEERFNDFQTPKEAMEAAINGQGTREALAGVDGGESRETGEDVVPAVARGDQIMDRGSETRDI